MKMSSRSTDLLLGVLPLMVGALFAAYLLLWTVGVTPASAKEREFIATLKTSSFANRPRVLAALARAEADWYVSRRDFNAAADAFTLESRNAPGP